MRETSGRKSNQKMKPYLVYQYLLHHSDENHTVHAEEIVGYLQELGIDAERRSIYKDIEEINKAIWIIENDSDIEELNQMISEGNFEEEKLIIYDKHKKGFYTRQRKYDTFDIRLISECIYSSKYISQREAERLVSIMKDFISDYQAKDIRTDALVTNRIRTFNKNTLGNVSVIYDAMSKLIDGNKHIPEKISFQYLKHSIDDLSQQVERHKGAKYVVSPYKLIINDGNYYLLAYDDKSKEIRTYRVDRMKSIVRTGQKRDGEADFKKIDLKSYTRRTFSMFSGEEEYIRLQFDMRLLDTVIERFGLDGASYQKSDEEHFIITTNIEISEQFFGWLCGFGTKATIISPEGVKQKFSHYLDQMRSMY